MVTSEQQLPKGAIFIDSENQPDLNLAELLERLPCEIIIKYAYADWRNRRLNRLAGDLETQGFKMYHFSSGSFLGSEKDKADHYMAEGIEQALQEQSDIVMFIIVSGDRYFAEVVKMLKSQCKRVIVAANHSRTSKQLQKSANVYYPLGGVTQKDSTQSFQAA